MNKEIIEKMSQLEKEMEEAVDIYFWQPQEGDYIVGILEDIVDGVENKFGGKQPVLILQDKKGNLWSVFGTADIKMKIKILKPERGDLIGIKRLRNRGRRQRYLIKVWYKDGTKKEL